jgi:hypothetical protein
VSAFENKDQPYRFADGASAEDHESFAAKISDLRPVFDGFDADTERSLNCRSSFINLSNLDHDPEFLDEETGEQTVHLLGICSSTCIFLVEITNSVACAINIVTLNLQLNFFDC